MPKEKRYDSRNRFRRVRFAVTVAFILGSIHLMHTECSETADNPVAKYYDYSIISEDSIQPVRPAREYQATAYNTSGTTRSGVQTAPGVVSADPKYIPLGSLIHIDSPLYSGVYQVLDTGRLVKGRIVDIFIPDFDLCMQFGRRNVKVTVLRYGYKEISPEDSYAR
jgi:3D (Asp-Asp-Asp) domain-containing protein